MTKDPLDDLKWLLKNMGTEDDYPLDFKYDGNWTEYEYDELIVDINDAINKGQTKRLAVLSSVIDHFKEISIKDSLKKDELLLKISNLNDDEDFNEIPLLADALFEYDEKAAIELLRRAEDAAVHLDNYVKISETISEHTSDYEWFGRVHYKGFEEISEDFADGEDNHGLWDSPEECAYDRMENWYTPFFNEEDEKYKGFNKVLKPINKEALQFMEELCSSSEDYENFLGYLDDKNYGFPDDKEWIQRIENKC